jgi:hypothetical protein
MGRFKNIQWKHIKELFLLLALGQRRVSPLAGQLSSSLADFPSHNLADLGLSDRSGKREVQIQIETFIKTQYNIQI